MKHNWQTFTGDRVKDLLHQYETLSGSKIGDAPARNSKTFARGGCTVFGFGFYECEFLAPEIRLAVRDLGLIATSHCRGRRDGISASPLRDVGFDPNDHAGAIRRGRYSGIRR